jgi:hypothetical protein
MTQVAELNARFTPSIYLMIKNKWQTFKIVGKIPPCVTNCGDNGKLKPVPDKSRSKLILSPHK